MWPHATLTVLAAWTAWLPAESSPATPVVVAAILLALVGWGWHRTERTALRRWTGLGGITVVLVALAGLSGAAPARALSPLCLGAVVVLTAWLASRSRPPETLPVLLAAGLSLLAVWAAWQSTVGLDRVAGALAEVPEGLHVAFLERIESRRGFASLPLPGHLAVVMATALPLLVAGVTGRRLALVRVAGAVLCVVGLVVSRSPLGLLLALAATTGVVVRGTRRWQRVVSALLVTCLAVVVVWRADVLRLEPVRLRLDNWQTAVWAWSTSPVAGVGPGGFAYLARQAPLEVGNRPAHAHSLPLEALAELGPLGMVSCLLLIVTLLRVVAPLWRRRPALATAVLVIPAHNLVDFSLFVSGVALPWAVLLGWSVAEAGEPPTGTHSGRGNRVALVALLAGVTAAVALDGTARMVQRAATRAEAPDQTFELALRAHALAPWRLPPLATLGRAALGSDDPRLVTEAARRLDRWRWLSPRSSAWSALRVQLALHSGDPARAVAEARDACRLEAGDPEPCRTYEALLHRLEAVGARD